MSLELSPEVEQGVRAYAAREGVSVNDLLARTFLKSGEEGQHAMDPKEYVRSLLAQWQADDHTPTLSSSPPEKGETPSQALFRKWEMQDDAMTEEEWRSEERLSEEIRQSIDAERSSAGMRTLF